jgi:hypothetical protein
VLFTLAGAMALGLSLVDSLLAVVVGNVMAALYLSFAALLVFSPSVNAFLKYQREDVRREQQAVLDRLRDDYDDGRRDDYDDGRRDRS